MVHFFKPKQYKLRIDNPCSENWEKMTSAEGGKFCQNCSKNVIDFTNLSDKEIIQIISKSPGNLCGRLAEHQLNRSISYKKESSYSNVFSKIAASLLFVGLSKNVHAAPISKSVPIEFPDASQKNKAEQNQVLTDSTALVLKGKVLDARTKEELPGVIILIKNTTIATPTNLTGDFELIIPDYLRDKEITIVVMSLGYITQEVSINTNNIPIKNEFLLGASYQGGLSAKVVYVHKKQWWQFWKKNILKLNEVQTKYKASMRTKLGGDDTCRRRKVLPALFEEYNRLYKFIR